MKPLLGLLMLLALPAWAVEEVRVAGSNITGERSHNYYLGLLTMALKAGAQGKAVPRITQTQYLPQTRALQELKKGNLDLIWTGLSSEREQMGIVVPIPLDKGLMGYRRLMQHKDNRQKLMEVDSVAGLKQLIACQGINWPDTEVLSQQGFLVLAHRTFMSLFDLTRARKCDYFPRSMYEWKAELIRFGGLYPELEVHPSVMLYYPSSKFFFIGKSRPELTTWLTRGLEKLISTGELDAYLRKHPLTNELFPLSRFAHMRIFSLPNPYLGEVPDPKDKKYWIQPSELSENIVY